MSGFGSILRDYLEYHKISQTDFADRLGITQKHMNEIINGKTSISLELMMIISLLTDIDVNLIYYVENKKNVYNKLINKYKNDKEINKLLNSYYINEMEKRGWIKLKDKSSLVQKYLDLVEFLKVKDLDTFNSYINKRYLFKKKDDSNDIKISLWINHCDNMINKENIINYNSNKFDLLLKELRNERMKKYNEQEIINILRKYGIILYIEDALKGSKIRGCCKVMVDTPVIYITKYYKEKSSFYFTLYHELMHIKKDFNMLKNKIYINENEEKIDELALEEMIPNIIYKKILEDYSNRDKIALANKIPLCFLYTRLAKEKIIKYNSKEYLNNIERIDE